MGMSTGPKSGLQAEINVTPLIDVLLVLLIIFLVVMPIVMEMQTLAIPRALAPEEGDPPPFLTVLVKPDLSIELSDETFGAPTPVAARDLPAALATRLRGGSKVVFVDFDPAVRWRDAVDAIDQVRSVNGQVALKVQRAPGT